MSRIGKMVDVALRELWGWSPNGITWTPTQQCNAIRNEIETNMRDMGTPIESLDVGVDDRGSCVVTLKVKGIATIKAIAASVQEVGVMRRRQHDMNAAVRSEEAESFGPHDFGGES